MFEFNKCDAGGPTSKPPRRVSSFKMVVVVSSEKLPEAFSNITEIFEQQYEHAINTRSQMLSQFKEFGPPDLVFVTKTTGAKNSPIISSVHFAVGVNVSCCASVGAYINSLSNSMNSSGTSWLPFSEWKVTKVVYCSYNAFSGCDVRVEAKIPGGTKAYALNTFGQRIAVTAEIWDEVSMCAFMRSISYSLRNEAIFDNYLCRKLTDCFREEEAILAAAVKLLSKGAKTGLKYSGSQATNSRNNFLESLYDYFCFDSRFEEGQTFFEKLQNQNPCLHLNGYIAKFLLKGNQESKAIRMLTQTLKNSTEPANSVAYLAEVEFLISKCDLESAFAIASAAIKRNPLDFWLWMNLVEICIQQKDYCKALSLLNSFPIAYDSFDCSYELLLSCITSSYISCPTEAPTRSSASFMGIPQFIKQSLSEIQAPEKNIKSKESTLINSFSKPKTTASTLQGPLKIIYERLCCLCKVIGWESLLKARTDTFIMENDDNCTNSNGYTSSADSSSLAQSSGSHANSKVLCEKWLDFLFLTLYDEQKEFSLWKAESDCFKSENVEFRRTYKEWQYYGSISERLGHSEDAIFALKSALECEFHVSTATMLASLYLSLSNLEGFLSVLGGILKEKRNHFDSSFYYCRPTKLYLDAIQQCGLRKIAKSTASIFLNDPLALKLLSELENYAARRKIPGYDK